MLGFEAPKSEESGEKLALRVEFDLDSASYATMALREILKSETSNVNQRALTEAMMAMEKVDQVLSTYEKVPGENNDIATPEDGKVDIAVPVE